MIIKSSTIPEQRSKLYPVSILGVVGTQNLSYEMEEMISYHLFRTTGRMEANRLFAFDLDDFEYVYSDYVSYRGEEESTEMKLSNEWSSFPWGDNERFMGFI
jgi:hypothetical protein